MVVTKAKRERDGNKAGMERKRTDGDGVLC